MQLRLLAALGQMVLYFAGFPEHVALLSRPGKHRRSRACLYLNKVADVDSAVLKEIVRRTDAVYPGLAFFATEPVHG